jgi:hypothetical protein
MGKNVITYLGSNFQPSTTPTLTINGETKAYTAKHRVAGGVVMTSHLDAYTNDKDEVCIYDDARTYNVQMGIQVSSIFEIIGSCTWQIT